MHRRPGVPAAISSERPPRSDHPTAGQPAAITRRVAGPPLGHSPARSRGGTSEVPGPRGVQAGGAAACGGGVPVELGQEALGAGGLAMEVAGVQGRAPHVLVDPAQLGDGELLGQEGHRERRVLELGAGALDGALEHLGVVEGQVDVGQLGDGPPAGVGHVVAALGVRQIGAEGHEGHRDDAGAGVAVRGAEGADLLEVHGAAAQRGLVGEHPVGGVVEVLLELDETAWERPGAPVGVVLALRPSRTLRASARRVRTMRSTATRMSSTGEAIRSP